MPLNRYVHMLVKPLLSIHYEAMFIVLNVAADLPGPFSATNTGIISVLVLNPRSLENLFVRPVYQRIVRANCIGAARMQHPELSLLQ
jgi:hypothetical protein